LHKHIKSALHFNSLISETYQLHVSDIDNIPSNFPENRWFNEHEEETRLKWYNQMVLPALSCGSGAWNHTRIEGRSVSMAEAKFIRHVAANFPSLLEVKCEYKKAGNIILLNIRML
jgi:hypothetical protein